MAGIVTPPDPAHVARFADMLAENARVHVKYDPEFATMLAYFARAFAGHAAIVSLIVPPPAPRRVHIVNKTQKAEAKARSDEWLGGFLRAVLPEDGTPPSNRAILRAAARDKALELPRRVIEQAIYRRWPERVPKGEGVPEK